MGDHPSNNEADYKKHTLSCGSTYYLIPLKYVNDVKRPRGCAPLHVSYLLVERRRTDGSYHDVGYTHRPDILKGLPKGDVWSDFARDFAEYEHPLKEKVKAECEL